MGIHPVKEMSITQLRAETQPDDIYDDGFLRVEHRNYYVACGGITLKLPRTEFLLFSGLVRTPNRIVTSRRPVDLSLGYKQAAQSREPSRYIYCLRAKLAESGLQIETMVKVGYRLITPTPEGTKH